MRVISARLIRKPRKCRFCDGCDGRHEIRGQVVRCYGYACHGDPPWVMWLCPRAALAASDVEFKLSARDLADTRTAEDQEDYWGPPDTYLSRDFAEITGETLCPV